VLDSQNILSLWYMEKHTSITYRIIGGMKVWLNIEHK